MRLTKTQLKQIIKEELDEGHSSRERWHLRQKIVNMLAEYFGVTIGEAELLFRSIDA